MPSFVWKHFNKFDPLVKKARCTFEGCNRDILYGNGTRALIKHLKGLHDITEQTEAGPAKRPTSDDPRQNNNSKRQTTMFEFSGRKPSMEEDIAKMVSGGTLSFNQIATCSFIRGALAMKYPGKIVPQDTKGISAMMTKFFEIAEDDVKQQIRDIKDGKKFSATLDEWTSNANIRYVNINIHYVEFNNKNTKIDLKMAILIISIRTIHYTCYPENMTIHYPTIRFLNYTCNAEL